MSLIQRMRTDERGATLVITALVLVVLMGFAAVAVDLAQKWSIRRQDQSASDTGSLAGGLFTANKSGAAAINAATEEVIRITYSTAQPDLTPAEWATAYQTCVDSAKPAEYTRTGVSDCVSFTNNLEKIRVRLPNVDFDTTFGAVLGVETISTTAFAEVQIVLQAPGGLLPFGLPGSSANDTSICLKTGANPKNVPPCDGPDNGNFAFLDISQYENGPMGTPQNCGTSSSKRLADNINVGADHPFGKGKGKTANGAPLKEDVDECPHMNARPWTLKTQPGTPDTLMDGLLQGSTTGTPGRLIVPSGTGLSYQGYTDVDHTPLWSYLNDDGIVYCKPLAAGGLTSGFDDWKEMEACLIQYRTDPLAPQPIFKPGIEFANRFAWIPLMFEDDLAGCQASPGCNIEEFRPVYLQTLLWKCNANECDIIHNPGEDLTGANLAGANKKINALSALQIPLQALDDGIVERAPGTDGAVTYVLIK